MFEVITKEEFQGSGVSTLDSAWRTTDEGSGVVDTPDTIVGGSSTTNPLGTGTPSYYCEFCKGYYHEEYHVQRMET